MKTIKYIDLFAGIGGMRIALERAAKKMPYDSKCVFTSEIDKYCVDTYQQNFHQNNINRDIAKMKNKEIDLEIKKHHILLAGFPCQPFSIAGVSKKISMGRPHGFEDETQGTLFFDIVRIIRRQLPRMILLENVKNLKSHDKGNTLRVILKILRSYYYVPDPQILNARDFGLPQNRERIYIVGFINRKNKDFVYPKKTKIKTQVGDILEPKPDKKYFISDRLWKGHKDRKERNKKAGKGFGYKIYKSEDEYTRTISSRYYKDGADALIFTNNKNPRKLTPRECARLQGFPEDFIINKSDQRAYMQFGNSVPVNVVERILHEMLLYFYSKQIIKSDTLF